MFPEITVSEHVAKTEREYHLPALLGSERQIAWARLIRFRLLNGIFSSLLEKIAQMPPEDRQIIYKNLDGLRAETCAKIWIEVHRHHGDEGVGYLPWQTSFVAQHLHAENEKKQQKEREGCLKRAKALEQRQLLREAERLERVLLLPELEAASPKQLSFARRCRYVVLSLHQNQDTHVTDAGFWIAQFLARDEEKAGKPVVNWEATRGDVPEVNNPDSDGWL